MSWLDDVVDDTTNTLEKAYDDTVKTVGKAAEDTGSAISGLIGSIFGSGSGGINVPELDYSQLADQLQLEGILGMEQQSAQYNVLSQSGYGSMSPSLNSYESSLISSDTKTASNVYNNVLNQVMTQDSLQNSADIANYQNKAAQDSLTTKFLGSVIGGGSSMLGMLSAGGGGSGGESSENNYVASTYNTNSDYSLWE